MDNTLDALRNLYVALGGELTDTYDDIANGETVENLVIIPDLINAIAELKTAQAEAAAQATEQSAAG